MSEEPHKLGKTRDEISIDSLDDNRTMALSLASQARHSIDIFSQDLEHEIYNNEAFGHALLTLAKRHPSTRIRILVINSLKAVQNGHRIIQLAQKLTSSISIHSPAEKHKDEQGAFLIADKIGVLHRSAASSQNYKANVNFMSPLYATKMTDLFNERWEGSEPDIQTRRIHV